MISVVVNCVLKGTEITMFDGSIKKVEDIVLEINYLVNQLVVLMKMKIITKHGVLIDCSRVV
jgi:hypothetical protein